jgi:hypothetical protein
VQTDATRTCELVGLHDVTVLGVGERLRQPLEVCVDESDGSRVHAPEVPEGRDRRPGCVLHHSREATNSGSEFGPSEDGNAAGTMPGGPLETLGERQSPSPVRQGKTIVDTGNASGRSVPIRAYSVEL